LRFENQTNGAMNINVKKIVSGILILLNMLYLVFYGYIIILQYTVYPNMLWGFPLLTMDCVFGMICCLLSISVQLSCFFHYKKVFKFNKKVFIVCILSLIFKWIIVDILYNHFVYCVLCTSTMLYDMFVQHFKFYELYPLVLLIIGFLFVYFNEKGMKNQQLS